jgi:hypothetical protein
VFASQILSGLANALTPYRRSFILMARSTKKWGADETPRRCQ